MSFSVNVVVVSPKAPQELPACGSSRGTALSNKHRILVRPLFSLPNGDGDGDGGEGHRVVAVFPMLLPSANVTVQDCGEFEHRFYWLFTRLRKGAKHQSPLS